MKLDSDRMLKYRDERFWTVVMVVHITVSSSVFVLLALDYTL